MSFQNELIRLRKAAGLTQHELAVKSKVKRSLLSHLELGIRPPQVDCLTQLADFFRLTGADRQWFIDLGYIAHMPEPARAYFERITSKLYAAECRAEFSEQGLIAAKALAESLQARVELLSKRK